MDQRLDPVVILGISRHEAQVIRNAGGYATDDAIRSLCLSQQLAGTRRIVVLHHSDCRASQFADQELRAKVEAGTGVPADVGHPTGARPAPAAARSNGQPRRVTSAEHV